MPSGEAAQSRTGRQVGLLLEYPLVAARQPHAVEEAVPHHVHLRVDVVEQLVLQQDGRVAAAQVNARYLQQQAEQQVAMVGYIVINYSEWHLQVSDRYVCMYVSERPLCCKKP